MADLLAPFFSERAAGLAERLIARFGGLSGALASDSLRIDDPELADACRTIQAARKLTESAVREDLDGSPVQSDDPRLIGYLRSVLCIDRKERFHAVFADRSGRYLRDETVAFGSMKEVRVDARHLFHRALELGANKLLLAHNHPSNCCQPSALDIETTEHLRSIAACLDVVLMDHLVVTRSGAYSIRDGREL